MAFSYTIKHDATGRAESYGSFNGDSVTTGQINTGLNRVSNFQVTLQGAAVSANAVVVNETIAADGTIPGKVDIVFNSGDKGFWFAKGV